MSQTRKETKQTKETDRRGQSSSTGTKAVQEPHSSVVHRLPVHLGRVSAGRAERGTSGRLHTHPCPPPRLESRLGASAVLFCCCVWKSMQREFPGVPCCGVPGPQTQAAPASGREPPPAVVSLSQSRLHVSRRNAVLHGRAEKCRHLVAWGQIRSRVTVKPAVHGESSS